MLYTLIIKYFNVKLKDLLSDKNQIEDKQKTKWVMS